MKNKSIILLTVLAIGTIAAVSGCGVPRTHLSVTIGKARFGWDCPKQFVATNIVAEINTNGTASFTVGYLESKNDAVVIDKAAAGDVARLNAATDAALKLGGAALQMAK